MGPAGPAGAPPVPAEAMPPEMQAMLAAQQQQQQPPLQ